MHRENERGNYSGQYGPVTMKFNSALRAVRLKALQFNWAISHLRTTINTIADAFTAKINAAMRKAVFNYIIALRVTVAAHNWPYFLQEGSSWRNRI